MDATSGLDISTVGYCVGQYSYYICPAEAGHSGLLLTLFSIGNTESNDNDVQAPGNPLEYSLDWKQPYALEHTLSDWKVHIRPL